MNNLPPAAQYPPRPPLRLATRPNKYVQPPSNIEVWGTAIGVWGDVLAACGNLKALHGHGGMIYLGKHPQIEAFLRRQPFIDDVKFVQPATGDEWITWVQRYCVPRAPVHELCGWNLGLTRDQIVQTNMIDTHLPPTRWRGARLDPRFIGNGVFTGRDYLLVQPYSLIGSPPEWHYEHWQRVLDYLLDYTPYNLVIVGQGYEIQGEHDRVFNRIGWTESMEEVFALARLAKGVVTTSNALAMWCAMEHTPAVVCGSNSFPPINPYRYWIEYKGDWLDRPPLRVVDFDSNFAAFIRAFWEVIPQ